MGYSICLAPARSPYAVVWAVPTSPYEARFGVPRFAPACAGRGGRGYAQHWAVSGTRNIALKVITSSAFRALPVYRSVCAQAYSLKCLEWAFSEVRFKGILGSLTSAFTSTGKDK